MIHPLLARLAMEPQLLAEHAGAYAELAAAEAGALSRHWQRRALLLAIAGGCGLLALGLGGVSALLAGALPISAMPQPWLLLAVPALPLVIGLGCFAWMLHDSPAPAFPHLREQLAADAEWIRHGIEPSS